MTQVFCIVTDHYNGASLEEEDVPGRVHRISWGNKLGSQTASIKLDGKPQYLHIGTINALKEITLPRLGKDNSGREYATINGGKRFSVIIVDGWTEEQLEQERKKQKARKGA
jgi:hypothetical protein